MTLTDELQILNEKIKANQAQYDLDREAAKISALSRGDLGKYEYLTGEDLRYKRDVIQGAKFILHNFFMKGWIKKIRNKYF